MKGGLDAQIAALYALPFADFTAARNELAKGAGQRAAEVRALVKPPVAAWAVNQIYWNERGLYDALIDAASEMRKAHAAVLGGRRADVRAATKAHEEQVSAAAEAAAAILEKSGHPVTDATRQGIVTTLRALPADEPGMLTRVLQPGGFEALAGLSIKGAKGAAILKPAAKPAPKPAPAAGKESPREAKAREKAREAVAHAKRVLTEAERDASRQEFELARAAREEEKAAKAVEAARAALERAEDELKKAAAAQAAAHKKRETAERENEDATEAVIAARAKVGEAEARLGDR
jgi:hypothetical protein